jgi:two-component system invasion response regulator UvrY
VIECKEIKVIYSADNPQDACDAYRKFKPDVVVIAILFKGETTDLDPIKAILNINPQAKVIILSQHDQVRLIKEAYQLGVLSFIPKNVDSELLIEAIIKAATGERYLLPEVAQKLASLWAEQERDPKCLLSQCEFEIYRLIAEDRSKVEIAHELGLPQKTVNNALFALRSKLGLKKRTEFTKHALRHGIIRVDDFK